MKPVAEDGDGAGIAGKLDAILRNQRTLNDEVHGVVQRLSGIERWKEDQEQQHRRTQRSLTESEVRDEVATHMVASVEERFIELQASVKAMTAAQQVAAETNRHQTEAVKSLAISASMAPTVAKLRRRLPAYLAIASVLGAVLAAFIQAYLHAKGIAP